MIYSIVYYLNISFINEMKVEMKINIDVKTINSGQ